MKISRIEAIPVVFGAPGFSSTYGRVRDYANVLVRVENDDGLHGVEELLHRYRILGHLPTVACASISAFVKLDPSSAIGAISFTGGAPLSGRPA